MVISELQQQITQKDFAVLVGISGPAVTDLMRRAVIKKGDSAAQWLIDYCAHMREQAAGRAAAGDLDLATERAGLAREQKLLTEIKRRRAERELAPVALMTVSIARVAAQISALLDAVPGRIKRTCGDVHSSVLEVVEGELSKARNLAADITVDIDDINDDFGGYEAGATQRDTGRARAA